MKAREYRKLKDAPTKLHRFSVIRMLFCRHEFVLHRLDKELFENSDDLYVTCSKCDRQYISKNFFEV